MKKVSLFVTLSALMSLAIHAHEAHSGGSAVQIKSYTASESGHLANSHLLIGHDSAVLVDAQFTRSEAKKVAELVRSSGKKLTTIFITHAHPDHYFGLEILSKEFPDAKILARQSVIDEIKATAQKEIDHWKQTYKEDLADTYVLPAPFSGKSFRIGEEVIQVADFMDGESANFSVLYLPSTKTLVTGDLVANQVHLWLVENRPEGWLKNLADVRKLGPISNVLPGHGANGEATLLKENENYIRAFLAVTKGRTTKEVAAQKLKEKFPNYRLPIIADLSTAERVR